MMVSVTGHIMSVLHPDQSAPDSDISMFIRLLPIKNPTDFTDRKNIYTCGIEYEVDEVNRTVRQVWQYGKERGAAYFTPARSGVQYLEQTGNRLICPGMSNVLSNGNRGARVTEVDPETQDVVFELELEDAIYQRVYRMSLYPENQ